jgi:hypothetical protein
MKRIDVKRSDAGLELVGDHSCTDFALASEDDVTFPAVWMDGERVYDVEVWRDGELIATVPPRSDDVDAAFDEHESRRFS